MRGIPLLLAATEQGTDQGNITATIHPVPLARISGLQSFKELAAFNISQPLLAPGLDPIFKFATLCSIDITNTWPILKLDSNKIQEHDLRGCTTHLELYAHLYSTIQLEGWPESIIPILPHLKSSVELHLYLTPSSIRFSSLHVLFDVSNGYKISLHLESEIINVIVAQLLARYISDGQIIGLHLVDMKYPAGTDAIIYNAIPFSHLQSLFLHSVSNPDHISDLIMNLPTTLLKRVSLVNCGLWDYMHLLRQFLPQSHVTHLDVSFNELYKSRHLIRYLMSPKLTSLNLAGNELDLELYALIVPVMHRSNLECLDLSHNNIRVITSFMNTIARSKITTLNLASNHLLASSLSLIARSLHLTSLKVLDLSNNNILDMQANLISTALKNSSLSLLIVNACGIRYETMVEMRRGFNGTIVDEELMGDDETLMKEIGCSCCCAVS